MIHQRNVQAAQFSALGLPFRQDVVVYFLGLPGKLPVESGKRT